MPLLGADPINRTYHYLAGNRAAIPGTLFTMIAGAGFGEETLFRGYMFERLGKLFGPGMGAKISIVLLTSVLFGLATTLSKESPASNRPRSSDSSSAGSSPAGSSC